MSETIAPLVRDLVAWVAAEPRPYREVIEAWRTSCPRLTVWEAAVEGGYIALGPGGPAGLQVSATPRGRALLAEGRSQAGSWGFASTAAARPPRLGRRYRSG